MHFVDSDRIMVPQVGLKDGLIYELYERISSHNLDEVEVLDED